MLKVNEIFYSIQGEGKNSGLPCVFVRLTYCNLRCTYCDTEYAFFEGKDTSVDAIIQEVSKYNCNLVEVTGGEPLMQKQAPELMRRLCEAGFEVMLETGGSLSIETVDKRVKIIMDYKCPSSGMVKRNLYENVLHLKKTDEAKFVIGSREDYEWAKKIIDTYKLLDKCEVLFSTVFGELHPRALTEWILSDQLKVRMQLQIHKFIWDPDKRGV